MRRQTPRENLVRWKEKVPLRNELSTTEHVQTRKGESNDSHSHLAWSQLCIQRIERDISLISPQGPGQIG